MMDNFFGVPIMSEPSTTDNAAWKAAQNWINTVTRANQWRVQILSRRYRKDPTTGERKAVPVRIRRFAEGCPASGMAQALECLLAQAPYTGVIFNGQVLTGAYRPTLTEWRRDDQTVINGQQRTDGTYTLVQDLLEDGYSDDWSGQTTGTCSEKVESMYVWDADSIQTLPDEWQAQGVTYAIQSVGHQEDGTFNYVLVKRTALTQITPETASADNEYETASTKTYKNLYGVPPSFRDDSGAVVHVPSASDAVEVQTRLNDDCTYDVVVQTKAPKTITSEASSSEVIDERSSSVTKRGQANPLPEAPDAEAGLIKTHKSDLRPDGRFDTTEQSRQEQEVLDAVVTMSVTRKGKRVTRVNRNQSAAASTENLEVGSEVKSEKTPGHLFNNSVSAWDRTEPSEIGERCEESLFEHTDEATTGGASMPGPDDHVAGGGAGGHVKRRVTTVDDDGAVIQTVTDKLEKPVVDAVTETSVTLRGRRVTTVNRNMPSAATPSSAIGSSVRNEKTEGGLVTQTLVETSTDPIGNIKEECVQSGLEHRHSQTDNVVSKPNVEVGASVADGTIVEKSVFATEFATFDVTMGTRTAKQAYHEETYGSAGQSTVETVYRNIADMPVEPGGVNVETRASFSINDFKLLDGHVARTTFAPNTLGPLTAGNTQAKVETTFGRNVVAVPTHVGAVNEDVSVSASANDHGSYDYTARRVVYRSVSSLTAGTSAGPMKTVEVKLGKNNVSAPRETAARNQEFSLSATMNDHGSFDWSSRRETYHPYGPVVVASTTSPLRDTEVKSAYNQTSEARGTGKMNVDVSVSSSLNPHGSFDWNVRTDTYKPYGPVVMATSASDLKTTQFTAACNQTSQKDELAGTNEEVSVSASLNPHGSFDLTVRKDTYKPYGPVVIATSTGNFKTTQFTVASNQTSKKDELAGTNEEVSVSASLNSHGSFDYMTRRDTYQPYGPVVVAQVAGLLKDTVIRSAFNQTSVAQETSGQNVEISTSASLNQHGSFDWTTRKDTYKPYGPKVVATTVGPFRTTVIQAAYNQPQAGNETAATNEELSVSASLNPHGSFDYTTRRDKYIPYGPQLVATTDTPVMMTRQFVGMNNPAVVSKAGGNELSTMSVSVNQRGTFDTNEVVRIPHAQEKEVSWTTGSGAHLRAHRMVVYRNLDTPKSLDGTVSASASMSINEFGLCDGMATTTGGWDGSAEGGGNKYAGSGGCIAHYLVFQTPGGKRWKQRVTLNVSRMIDRAVNVAQWLDGGESFGPYHSGFDGASGGRDSDGVPLVCGVRYSDVNFDAPEEIE